MPILPTKRPEQEDRDDEHEIMALLDEIDQINPLPSSNFHFSGDSKTSTQKGFAQCQAGDDLDDFLSSDVDLPEATKSTILQTVGKSYDLASQQGAAIPLTSYQARPITSDVLQYLPHPFFPETFSIADWTRNVVELESLPSESRVKINKALALKTGEKVPFIAVMVKEHYAHTRDAGVCLVDETGEMTATIQDTVLTRHKLRVHFGMTLVLRDVVIFSLGADSENHLIITPDNVIHVFSNVHHL